MGRKWDTPQLEIDLSKRFNAALRHSIGCIKDKRNHFGLPCDEAGWVNVEHIMKYDQIWRDGHTLAGTSEPDYKVIVKDGTISRRSFSLSTNRREGSEHRSLD